MLLDYERWLAVHQRPHGAERFRTWAYQEYLIESGKLGKTFESGMQLDDMTFRGQTSNLVAVSAAARKILLINAAKLTLEKEASLRAPAAGVSPNSRKPPGNVQ